MANQEHRLQTACVTWFNLQYPSLRGLLFSIPNGAYTGARQGAKLKREGVVSGVSDLILLKSNFKHHGLCIEMKYGNNRPTDRQQEWGSQVALHGFLYRVIRDVDSFQKLVNDYIGNNI